MKTTFIHTSDWQLGMTRRFLKNGADERYAAARMDAVRSIGRVVKETQASFVVVAGDVFESNQVGRRVILQAAEALREIPVTVYLLPGNHDPLTQASVYTSPVFRESAPKNVHVIMDENPIAAAPGVELIGAPWLAKNIALNPAVALLERLEPAAGVRRIVLAHGPMDGPGEFPDNAATIPYKLAQAALRDGRMQYLALGDRHSYTLVGGNERLVYSGTPEVTAFRDPDAGHVSVVHMDGGTFRLEKRTVGTWRFIESEADITGPEDAEELFRTVDDMEDKIRTVLRLKLTGLVDIGLAATIQEKLAMWEDVFAGIDVTMDSLHTAVRGDEPSLARFGGFAARAVGSLREMIDAGGPEAETARDALLLFLRLAPDVRDAEGEA